MKFYKEKLRNYTYRMLCINKSTAIINSKHKANYIDCVYFLKNGMFHNAKNATYTDNNRRKSFYLNNKFYGNQYVFTKKSWRKFVKIQAFL